MILQVACIACGKDVSLEGDYEQMLITSTKDVLCECCELIFDKNFYPGENDEI